MEMETKQELAAEELARINQFAKAELTAADVYVFSVRLCDNEVDRDFELSLIHISEPTRRS